MKNDSEYNISRSSAKSFPKAAALNRERGLKVRSVLQRQREVKNNNEAAICVFVSQFAQSSADTQM